MSGKTANLQMGRWSNAEETVRTVLASGLLLLAFVPLVVLDSAIYPEITGKAFLFRAGAFVLAGIWVGWMVIQRRSAGHSSPLSLALVAFVGWVALVDLSGSDPWASFYGTFTRADGLLTTVALLAYFGVAGWVLEERRIRLRVFAAWVGVFGVASVLAILEYLDALARGRPVHRVEATLGNPSYLASCLALSLFLVVLLLEAYPRRRKLLVGMGWLQLVALILTGTRSAFVGLGAGIVVAALLVLREAGDRRELRRGALQVVASAVVVVLAIGLAVGGGLMQQGEAGASAPPGGQPGGAVVSTNPVTRVSDAATLSLRLMMWRIGLAGVAEAPLLGHGRDGFQSVVDRHLVPELEFGLRQDKPHNVLLEWAVIAGIPGAALYLLMLGAGAWLVIGATRATILTRAAFLGLLTAYLVNGLLLFDTPTSYFLLFTVLAGIHAMGRGSREESEQRRRTVAAAPGWPRVTGGVCLAAVAITVGVVACLPPLLAARSLGIGYARAQQGDVRAAAVLFEDGLAMSRYGPQGAVEIVVDAASKLAARQAPIQSAAALRRQELGPVASLAIDASLQEVEAHPDRRYTRRDLGQLLHALGRLEQAREQLEEELRIAPRDPAAQGALAMLLLDLGEHHRAYALARQAAESSGWQRMPAAMYASTALAIGRSAEARPVLEHVFDHLPPARRRAAVEDFVAQAERKWGGTGGP